MEPFRNVYPSDVSDEECAAKAAAAHGIALEVVKLPQAERGVVLLPRRRVIERSFA